MLFGSSIERQKGTPWFSKGTELFFVGRHVSVGAEVTLQRLQWFTSKGHEKRALAREHQKKPTQLKMKYYQLC